MATLTTHGDKTYKTYNGTYYHPDTPDEVIAVLETARSNGTRIRVHYGYTDKNNRRASDNKEMPAGRDWHEENDVTGTVGRSMGPVKIPLMIATSRSMGGGGILTHCIVRIRTTGKNGKDLYKHPNYSTGKVEIRPVDITYPKGRLTSGVFIDGVNHAAFTSEDKARKWLVKMGLTV